MGVSATRSGATLIIATSWARRKMLRAAFIAGTVAGQGANRHETTRTVGITIAETDALPQVRDAHLNRPISGVRYADITAFGLNLVHWRHVLAGRTNLEQHEYVLDLHRPLDSAREYLRLLRSGAVFHGETRLRDDPTLWAKRQMTAEVVKAIEQVWDASEKPVTATLVAKEGTI